MSVPQTKLLTTDQYLAWEAEQEYKNEYVAGEIFAMTRASDGHVTAMLNLAMALKSHLRGSPCQVYAAEMKLDVGAANAFFYPDVFVTCDRRDREQAYYKSYPVLVAEVLSPTTSAYDRGRKFAYYRMLESLQDYVLIDPASLSVDLFRRGGDGHWVLYPYQNDEMAELSSVGLSVPLAAIFEGVPLQTQGGMT